VKITMTRYSDTFTVTREELDAARRTSPPMQGVAYMVAERRRFEIGDQLEREMFAAIEHDRAYRRDYPRLLAEWQEFRRREVAAIEFAIEHGRRFTIAEIESEIARIWAIKPTEPRDFLRNLRAAGPMTAVWTSTTCRCRPRSP